MSEPADLELGRSAPRTQRPGRERRLMVAQRIGWSLLALIVVAALAGLIGPGPLSQTTRSDPSGLIQLEYERFTRQISDTTLQLQVQPDPADPDVAQVWISSAYLSGVQVQQVQPEPESWVTLDGGVLLTFPVRGADPATVQLQIRADQAGRLPGAVGIPGREPLEFWQFVYP